jgi:NAD+ diphosphatase
MIQEILPHRFDNRYPGNKNIGEKDYILHFNERSLLLKINGDEFEIPRREDFTEISDKTESSFLFTLDDVPCFLIWDTLKSEKPRFIFKEINFFRNFRRQELAWISIVGFHLMNWYSNNRYCGKCGTRTQQKPDERALICPDCHRVVFPNINPAVIVAIISDHKILLARNTNFPGNWFSLIAGYVDIGESLEEALIREVKEEVGLEIKNIRYYKSQPWPLSGSMMIGFVAEADDSVPINADKKEIAEAAWFARGELPKHSSGISIAGEMIGKFEKGEL